jgi:hypothetical protein
MDLSQRPQSAPKLRRTPKVRRYSPREASPSIAAQTLQTMFFGVFICRKEGLVRRNDTGDL